MLRRFCNRYNIKFRIELVYLVLLCVAVSIGWRFGDGFSMMERLSLGGPANIDVGFLANEGLLCLRN